MLIEYMKIEDAVSTLKNFKFVHSIILFGSRAKGTGRRDSYFEAQSKIPVKSLYP